MLNYLQNDKLHAKQYPTEEHDKIAQNNSVYLALPSPREKQMNSAYDNLGSFLFHILILQIYVKKRIFIFPYDPENLSKNNYMPLIGRNIQVVFTHKLEYLLNLWKITSIHISISCVCSMPLGKLTTAACYSYRPIGSTLFNRICSKFLCCRLERSCLDYHGISKVLQVSKHLIMLLGGHVYISVCICQTSEDLTASSVISLKAPVTNTFTHSNANDFMPNSTLTLCRQPRNTEYLPAQHQIFITS